MNLVGKLDVGGCAVGLSKGVHDPPRGVVCDHGEARGRGTTYPSEIYDDLG